MMSYWVFNEQQVNEAISKYVAKKNDDGSHVVATIIKTEILEFLNSEQAKKLGMIRGENRS